MADKFALQTLLPTGDFVPKFRPKKVWTLDRVIVRKKFVVYLNTRISAEW